MLVEFRVDNHRSLRDEQVLTMAAGRISTEDSFARTVAGYDEPLLPVAALYGANASGKSNVFHALAFMKAAVLESQLRWSPDKGVPRNPFAWGKKKEQPSTFEITVLLDGVRYQYGFVVDDVWCREEWLYRFPKSRKQVLFARDQAGFKFGASLKGENRAIESLTRENALFLSTAVQFKHLQLRPLYDWFNSVGIVNSEFGPVFPGYQQSYWDGDLVVGPPLSADGGSQRFLLEEDNALGSIHRRVLKVLQGADLGILELRKKKPASQSKVLPSIEARHKAEVPNAWLPFREESLGTKTLFALAAPLLWAIDNGGLLVVDELEASLHPALVERIVREFNDPKTNPKNAQIVFTTHNTSLLGTATGPPVLRRDEAWICEKNEQGATTVSPLTDFKPRADENIERGYLQGRYGGVPYLSGAITGKEG